MKLGGEEEEGTRSMVRNSDVCLTGSPRHTYLRLRLLFLSFFILLIRCWIYKQQVKADYIEEEEEEEDGSCPLLTKRPPVLDGRGRCWCDDLFAAAVKV